MPLRRWLLVLSPLLIFGALIGWTAMISPYSKYGDNWAIDPAVISFPMFILWNIILVFIWRKEKLDVYYLLAGAGYVLLSGMIFFAFWLRCLSLISKDSL